MKTAALAVSLARPVCRGLLPMNRAEASLALACIREERDCTPRGTANLEEAMRFAMFTLEQAIKRETDQRNRASSDIERAIRPLIRQRIPRGPLRAAAHNANADNNLILTEAEVEAVIIDELVRTRARIRGSEPKRAARPRLHG